MADADQPHPNIACLGDGQVHSADRDNLAESLVTIDERQGWSVDQDLEGCPGDDAAVLQHLAVAAKTAHPLALTGMAA